MNNPSLFNIIKEKILMAYSEFLKSLENIKVVGIINVSVIVLGSIVFYVLSSIIFFFLAKKYESFREIRKPLKRLVFYILFFLLWEEIPGGFAGFMANLSLFLAFMKLLKVLDYFIVDVLMVKHYRTDVLQIFRDIIKAFIWIIMILILLKTLFGFSIKDIAITSAVVTAAIGFAFQDTLVNLIGGVSVIMEKSFKIGDVIELKDGEVGFVIQINWRTTRIRNRKNQVVIIPNKELSSAKIIHHNALSNIGRIFNIGLPYNISPAVVKDEILKFLENYDDVLKDPKPEVLLINFKDYFIEYQIRFFINDIKQALYIEDNIKTGLWYMLKRKGINIPYPVITVITEQKESKDNTETYVKGENLINYLNDDTFFINRGTLLLINEKTGKEIIEFNEKECIKIEETTKNILKENSLILTPKIEVEIIRKKSPTQDEIEKAKNNNNRIKDIVWSLYKIEIQKEEDHVASFMNINWSKWKQE